LQSICLNTKIEALELKLKKIQNELIMEKNRLGGDLEECLNIVEDHINDEPDDNIIDTNIDTHDSVEKSRLNPVR